MSEGRRKRLETGEVQAEPKVEPAKIEMINKTVADLINANVRLALKVAKCKCDKKDECEVYKHAQLIVEIIDKLQDLS